MAEGAGARVGRPVKAPGHAIATLLSCRAALAHSCGD